MINVGIIGLGFMGVTHYNIYKANPRARVAALCDAQESRLRGEWGSIGGNIGEAKQAEDLSGIKTMTDYREMLADPEIQLVDICLRTDFHREVAVAALKAGKHVLLEKPMAASVKDARAIRDAAKAAKGYFMVGHCIRFWPEYAAAHELCKSRRYGRVRELFMRRMSSPPTWGYQNWLMNAAASGGALLDLHIHDVDYALYLLGKPERISAWGDKGPSKDIDVVHASFDYANGARATLIGGWCYQGPFNMEFTIRCDKATLAYNLSSGEGLMVHTTEGSARLDVGEGDGYAREIDYLLECIEKRRRPKIVTADSSLESIEFVDRERRSIESGRPVRIAPRAAAKK